MADRNIQGDRLPPQATDIERAVIGAMLIDREAVGLAIESISEEYFYLPENSLIFRAITDLYDEHFPIDQLTVSERLRQRGKLEMAGGEVGIGSLVNETVSAANIKYHCQILREKKLLRDLIGLSTSARNKCFEDTADATDVLNSLEQGLMRLSDLRLSKSYEEISSIIPIAQQEIRKKSESKEGLTGVDTGFKSLNRLTSGWQQSDLVILAGRPSMGKTAFALDLAKNAASQNIPVGIFSLEMSSIQLVMRLLYNEGRFDGSSLTTKKPNSQDWTRLSYACSRLDSYPIYIDDTPGLSTVELAAKAKRLKLERNIGLLVVDYLQLMQGSSKESRQQEISSISRALKGLAKELSVPVIGLSQLSRALESRGGDHRPMLSDLRESGAIEQDADLVIFIYRSTVYGIDPGYKIIDQNVAPENVAEIIIRKQRNGPIGTILLHWIKEHTKFSDFEYERTDEYF